MKSKVLIVGIMIAAFAFVIAGGFAVNFVMTYEKVGKGESSVDWLPNSATNVSYYISYNHSAYEFDISEKEFRDWADDSQWEFSEIGTPIQIDRFCSFVESGSNKEVGTDEPAQAEISHGIYFASDKDPEREVSVAFDRDQNRAYFRSSRR